MFVVSFTHAGSNPWAMMVESFYTHVAIVTVCCSGRSENVASVAEFYFLWVRFHGAGVEYRLLLAHCTVQVSFTDGDLAEAGILIIAEYFGNYARIDQSQKDHENIGRNMKKHSKHDQVPIVSIRRKSIEQTHSDINSQKCSHIVLRFRYHKTESFLIAIIGDLSHLMNLIFRHPYFLFGASAHDLIRRSCFRFLFRHLQIVLQYSLGFKIGLVSSSNLEIRAPIQFGCVGIDYVKKKRRMDGARRKTVILLSCLLYNGEIMGLAIQIMIKKGLANKYSQQHSQNSARIVKLQKINNTFAHKNKPESAFTSISTIGYNAEKVQRKINLNDEILNRRKQNYLNTQYNRRLNNLKTITKENKKIYQRINSQKSLYSQEDMRRSSLSIRSSKSSSRVSNKSGLKQPMKNSKSYKPTKAKVAMTIQPQSVGNMKGQNLKQFQSVFMIGKKYSHHSKEGFAVPKRENRSFSLRNNNEAVQDQQKMGNMLHKIAEEMYKRSEKKPVYNKRKILY